MGHEAVVRHDGSKQLLVGQAAGCAGGRQAAAIVQAAGVQERSAQLFSGQAAVGCGRSAAGSFALHECTRQQGVQVCCRQLLDPGLLPGVV